MPSVWHMVELNLKGAKFSGACPPGLPAFSNGKNDHMSWGVTALYSDTSDLYEENIVDGTHYELDGKLRKLKYVEEVIQVKGEKHQIIQIPYTHRGPVF